MPSHRILSPLVAFLLLAGCSGDRPSPPVPAKPGGGTTPAAVPGMPTASRREALRLEPAEVYRGTSVRLSNAASLPAGATVEWVVNGEVSRRGGDSTFDTAQLRKGDAIQARAAGEGGTLFSQVVTVRNSPPETRGVRFVHGDGRPGSTLGVEAEGYDADGDSVRFEIAWRKNGEPAGTGTRLEPAVKRGDKVNVTFTPFDGEERGKSATISRDILNAPPVIEGQEQFQVDGNVVTFHVRATDTDGDSLAYSIKEAPAGMRIDRATGRVRWETPAGTTGKVPFAVTVSDGAGGESTARFTVTISEQPPSGAR